MYGDWREWPLTSRLILAEGKKLIVQREIYIALVLCTLLFIFSLNVNEEPDWMPLLFWKWMIDSMPYIGYWFITISIVVGAARCLPFEHEQRMEPLLHTYPGGHTKLLIAKLVVLLGYCALVVFYYFMVAAVVLAVFYEPGSLLRSAEETSANYVQLEGQWAIWQAMLMEYGYLLLSSFVVALCYFCLSQFIRKSVLIMLIGGGVFALTELLDKYVMNLIGQMHVAEYVGLFIQYSFNSLLSFRYLDFFEMKDVFVGLCVAAILLIGLNIIVWKVRVHAQLGD